MAVVEVSIVPIGTETPGLSQFVAGCLKVVKEEKNISFQLNPMGTVLEGDLETILKVIRKMHEQPFLSGALRVLTTIRIDDRRDRELTMSGKVEAVIKKLEP
ncbi:MAG: MTH1187 family thiamine-binding protein [Bacillota bacterium]